MKHKQKQSRLNGRRISKPGFLDVRPKLYGGKYPAGGFYGSQAAARNLKNYMQTCQTNDYYMGRRPAA